jgi:hypothetical protein
LKKGTPEHLKISRLGHALGHDPQELQYAPGRTHPNTFGYTKCGHESCSVRMPAVFRAHHRGARGVAPRRASPYFLDQALLKN